MRSLLEKIEADAEQRLTLPAQRHPSQELARYKAFLKLEAHRLLLMHRSGTGGLEVAQGRALVLDVLLRHVVRAVINNLAEKKEHPPVKFCLVAIGGYGRGELNPHSDVDILFLHPTSVVSRGKAHPYLGAVTDGVLYTLWDIGLKVGHSVRSPEDCVKVANGDMQSKTSLIEARPISGDTALFEQMKVQVLAKAVRGHENAYIDSRLHDQAARRAKFGNSASMQEPNIKNGCGGLRDYQNLLWMAFFKYRCRSLPELEEKKLINAVERKQLETAYDFLLWVRNDIHYHARRALDTLGKNIQPAIAHNLGYTDRSPSKRLEKFMRDLYTHMRNIYLLSRTLEQRLALIPQPKQMPSLKALLLRGRRRVTQQLFDGFKTSDGRIHQATPKVFQDKPRRLMRVFLHAQQRGLALHPDLAQLIRNELNLVNREFLRDERVHQTFLEILSQRGNVSRTLRAMHEVGFLGRYIPEFGKLTCLVQHEFYHQYTADEHTLVCLEKLDQAWESTTPPYNTYAEIFQELERPFILYLAMLLHDVGKGYPSDDHSQVGARVAGNVARRLGLDGATTHSLRLLIEHHLLMAQTSQRRDLEDPAVIQLFASAVQTRENLSMLTLHTFADSQGTSDKLWNGFKDTLLWTLFHKANALLGGGSEFLRTEERQLELLSEEVRTLLPARFSAEEIEAHFAHLPTRYFHIHTAQQIANDLELVHEFMKHQMEEEDRALEPVITWHNEPDRGYTSVHICTWDRTGLFSKVAGALTAAGLNILSAQIFTRTDGIVLDTFYVTDATSGSLAKKEERENFEKLLPKTLTVGTDLEEMILKRSGPNPVYTSHEGEQLRTSIGFDNRASESYTVMDIETEDRIGLLYIISTILSEVQINIALAKISTEKGAAIDTFYICDELGVKIPDDQHPNLEKRLRAGIQSISRLRLEAA